MWTHGQIVTDALIEIGIGDEATAEQRQTALRRLDMLMATWEAAGVRIGYAYGSTDQAMNENSGIPDAAVETVVASLACRLAPSYGKQVSPDTRIAAADGYEGLLLEAARPQPQQLPDSLPMGAGNRVYPFGPAYFPTPTTDPLPVSDGGDVETV